jgi:hypothetical protein
MDKFHNIAEFDQWATDTATTVCVEADAVEMFNGTLFVTGCTAREAAKLQTVFHNHGVSVVVTPSTTEYSFDFI